MQIREINKGLFVADLADNHYGTGKFPILEYILKKRESEIKKHEKVALLTSGNGEAIPFYFLCNKMGFKSEILCVNEYRQSQRESVILEDYGKRIKYFMYSSYPEKRKEVYDSIKTYVKENDLYLLDLREDPLGVLFAQNLYGTEIRNFISDQYKDFMATTFSIICPLDSLETTLGIARCLKTSSRFIGERAILKIIGVGSKNVNGLKPLSEACLFPTYTQFRGDKLLDDVLICEGSWVVNNLFAGDGISLSSQGFALLNEANGLDSDCVLIIQGHGITYD